MLVELDERFAESLAKQLLGLPAEDQRFFGPHPFDVASIRALSRENGNHYYVYVDEGGASAGYGMLRTFGKHEAPTLGCVIWQKHRGQGHGKRLVLELVAKARQLAYPQIRLKVHPDNRIAHRLYEKAGFKEVRKTENGLIWLEYDFGEEGNNDVG